MKTRTILGIVGRNAVRTGVGYIADRGPTGKHLASLVTCDDSGAWTRLTDDAGRVAVPGDVEIHDTEEAALAASRKMWR